MVSSAVSNVDAARSGARSVAENLHNRRIRRPSERFVTYSMK
jgi:hypothetical protein